MEYALIVGELTWEQNNSTKWSYLPKCILEILVSHHVAARNRSYFTGLMVERTLSQVYSRNIGNLMVRRIESTAESLLRNCSFSRLLRILESSIFLCTSVALSSLPIIFFHILGIRMFTLLLIKMRFLSPLFLQLASGMLFIQFLVSLPKASCWWFWSRKRLTPAPSPCDLLFGIYSISSFCLSWFLRIR